MKQNNKVNLRREKVLNRLEKQLNSGVKTCSNRQDFRYNEQIPLEDKDIKRIKSEIEILKSKINY